MKRILVSGVVVVLLGIAAQVAVKGSAAADKCSWRVEMQDGRRVAVSRAQPMNQIGRIEFYLMPGATTDWILEVRFKPGGKPRFSSAEILNALNDPDAWAWADIGGAKLGLPPLKRSAKWKYTQGIYIGEYLLPGIVIPRISTGWFGFSMDMANAIRDINPSGSARGGQCDAVIRSLNRQ